ncbi:TIGR03751 family conjugal transfer lipoprotein, partial [Klebsiella pneumoniae]|nr:TIGR03751 family conjugal transfer lipoprotein [Klebsiella pneumoniae]
VMYVFPHMTVGNVPVPGYSTVFPFYSQVQYALPGERVGAL